MKITPLDIKKQEFKKVMRGLDPIEVQTFLEMVADEFESLLNQQNSFSDELIRLKTELKDYKKVETTFKESLMSAQQTIKQSRSNSQREADLIIKEAELKADKILEDTKLRLIEMKNELMLIKSHKDSFAKRLRHLFESQLELIGVLEIDDLGIEQVRKQKNIHRPEKSADAKTAFKRPEKLDGRSDFASGSDTSTESPEHQEEKETENKKDNISNQIIM